MSMEKFPEQKIEDAPQELDSEMKHELLLRYLQEFLSDSKNKISNAGTNGLIYKLPIREMPFENNEKDRNSVGAVKILKVYTVGSAQKEAAEQKKAHKLISNQKEFDEIAHIPKIIDSGEITLNEESRENLKNQGTLFAGDKAEYIVMEYIQNKIETESSFSPANDLATLYAKAIVRYYQAGAISEEEISKMTASEALEEAFRYTRGIGIPTNEDNKDRVWNENKKLFYKHVRTLLRQQKLTTAQGVTITEKDIQKLIQQVQNTITYLHRFGIYHNDLHERNILVQENKNNETGDLNLQAYIIDFGSADSEEKEHHIKDEYGARQLQELLKENELDVLKRDFLDTIRKTVAELQNKNTTNKSIQLIQNTIERNQNDLLKVLFRTTVINDPQNEGANFLAAIQYLLINKKIMGEEKELFCKQILEKSKLPPKKGRIQPSPELKINQSTRNHIKIFLEENKKDADTENVSASYKSLTATMENV